MKGRLNTIKDVEHELNIRLGGRPSRTADTAASWEFSGAHSTQRWMRHVLRRRNDRRSSGGHPHATDPRQQRVIVKASYIAHHPDKVVAVLRAHVTYLGRDAASLDGREGRFYDAAEERINAKQRVQEWQNDGRHFRFIVSPEQGQEIQEKEGGLTAYTRQLMQRMEQDLGTKLQWIAINHYNTDDLHTHLLVRGVREDGKELRIDRQYLRQGMRQAAQEIATTWIGGRTMQQVKQAADKQLQADRYTSLDAFIERHVDTNHRLQWKVRISTVDRDQRRRVAARLQYLESMGLATRDRHGRWTVDEKLKPKLVAFSQRNDIIKNLYAALGPRSAFVVAYRGEAELIGTVAGRGTHDELHGRRYLLVRDAQRQLHYVRVANGEALSALEEGSVARVSGADSQRLRTDRRIAEVAQRTGGIYSSDLHRSALPQHFAAADVDTFLQSHERRLITLERLGAAQRVEQGWRIPDSAALAAGWHARMRAGLGVVQIISSRSIQSQINAEAWTWLDRQIHRQLHGKATSIPFNSELTKADQSRRQWMIDHGYAAVQEQGYVLRHQASQMLQRKEWDRLRQAFQDQHRKPARLLPPAMQVQGQYRGVVVSHDGIYAVIATAKEAVLAPVRRVPPLAYCTHVEARTSAFGTAVLLRLHLRTSGQSLEQDRGGEGMER